MLGERSAELDQFAGRMAHDVLSPLSSVSLALEFLRRRVGGDARIEATVTRALASLQRVRRIVDGLLEFARAGARPEPGAASDLRAVIEDVLEGAQPEAVEERIQLVAEPFATCRVACSPGVLTSLCSNLVHNAIRHMSDTDQRTVIVRVKAIEDHRRVEVEDTGPGVPAALATTLFDPFVRAQGHDPGIGLGLATVRRLVQGHGGEVGYRFEARGRHRLLVRARRRHPRGDALRVELVLVTEDPGEDAKEGDSARVGPPGYARSPWPSPRRSTASS